MGMRQILIAGGSIAGLSAARELRRAGFDGSIHMVDKDPSAPYRRPAVSKAILTAANEPGDIAIPVPAELDVSRAGLTLRELSVESRTVTGDQEGTPVRFRYDGLIIATGSEARPWSMPGALAGVYTLRGVADGMKVRGPLSRAGHVLIVGGGFIGLEVASAARAMGADVTVIEAGPVPLAHALGNTLGEHVAQMHRERGVRVRCNTTVTGLHGDAWVESVSLSDGTQADTDLVLACVGSQPSVGWLLTSGLDVSNGVICDHQCIVSADASIVAAGDVASWHNPLYRGRMRIEHWANAIEQGTFAARALLGLAPAAGFSSVPYFWSEQYGTRLQSVGTSLGHDEVMILQHSGETMVAGYGRAGQVIGVAGISAGHTVLRYRKTIEQRAALGSLADHAPVSAS